MAIDHAALATDIGKVLGGIKELNDFRGTTLTTRESDLRTEYGTDANDLLNDIAVNVVAARDSLDTWASYLSTLTASTIIAVVNDDRTLPTLDIDAALTEWVRQMGHAPAQSFNDCPVTLTFDSPATGAPAIVGDLVFHTSDKDVDGRKTDYGIPDRYLITVAADADNGGTRWAETLGIISKVGDSDVLDPAYPTGTGTNSTITVTDPAVTHGVVTDGGFDDYASGAFTSWTRLTGNTATEVFQTADDRRDGADGFCMTLKSDGVSVTGVKQTITPSPSTVYSLFFAVNGVNGAMAGAKLHVSVRRADTDAIVTDDQGVALSKTSDDMATIGTGTWFTYTADFALPKRLPADGVYLDIRLADGADPSIVATVATEIEVDHVVFQEMPALYDRGVRIHVYSGVVEPSRDDQWEWSVALTAGAISDYFIRWLDRTIGLAARALKVPTATGGAETLSDALIV